MKSFSLLIGTFVLSIIFVSYSYASECFQSIDGACVDWSKRYIFAVGVGAPIPNATSKAQAYATAQTAAINDARRKLLEIIKGVHLTSKTTIQNQVVSSDKIRTRLEGTLRMAQPIGSPRTFPDGRVEVRMAAPLDQMIPQDIAYPKQDFGTQKWESTPQHVAPPKAYNEPGIDFPSGLGNKSVPSSSSMSAASNNPVFTGLIIDTRGQHLSPALSPKVYDETGKEVYGTAYTERKWAIKLGVVGYAKTLEQARRNDRVQGNPLTIKALRKKSQTDIILSNHDAQYLRSIANHLSFLRECRVIFLVD